MFEDTFGLSALFGLGAPGIFPRRDILGGQQDPVELLLMSGQDAPRSWISSRLPVIV